MRRILVILTFCIFGTKAFAVYDPNFAVKRGKRWAVDVGLRTGYDDNPTTSSDNPQGSWFNGINLTGSYSYPTDTSFWGIRTSAGGRLFAERSGPDFDFSNAFDFIFAHTFSRRLNFELLDHLRFGQEPELGENNVVFRRKGDYINNGIQAGLSYELTPRWFLDFLALHDLWSYADPSLAETLNRQSFGGGPSARYLLTEKTTLSATYQHIRTDFEESPRDAQSHRMTGGINQSLSRRWNANLDAGLELRQEDNPLSQSSLIAPFVNLGTSYLLSEKSRISGGIRYSFQETDVTSFLVSRTLNGFTQFSWEFAPKLSLNSGLNVFHNDLTDSVDSVSREVQEMIYLFSNEITWMLNDEFRCIFGYTLNTVDSDLSLRSYQRNIISVGASYSF